MERDFDSEIATARGEVEAISTQMEQVRQRILTATADFLPSWIRERAKREVQGDSTVTLALGPEKLREVKGEVERLAAGGSELVEKHVNKKSVWWHLSPVVDYKHDYDPGYDKNLPKAFAAPIRTAMGQLGVLLQRYGYIGEKSRGPWISRDRTASQFGASLPSYFGLEVDWPQSLRDDTAKYAELLKKAQARMRTITEIESEKARTTAADLWDTV